MNSDIYKCDPNIEVYSKIGTKAVESRTANGIT